MMKDIYILIATMLFIFTANAQISVSGDANYELNIVGYMDRMDKGCGDIDGIRTIKAYFQTSLDNILYDGRKIYDNVNHSLTYTKNDKVNRVLISKILRYKNGIGTCDNGGSNTWRYNDIDITSSDFNWYRYNANDGLKVTTINSRPLASINIPKDAGGSPIPQILGDTDELKITLPDNLESQHYNWKYRIGNGSAQNIPTIYNRTNELKLNGNQFLPDSAIEQTISVWLEMGSDAGEKLATGIAVRDTYLNKLSACNELRNCINIRTCPDQTPTNNRNLCLSTLGAISSSVYDGNIISESVLQNYSSEDYNKNNPEFLSNINRLLTRCDNLSRGTICTFSRGTNCVRSRDETDEELQVRIDACKSSTLAFYNLPYSFAIFKRNQTSCLSTPRGTVCTLTNARGNCIRSRDETDEELQAKISLCLNLNIIGSLTDTEQYYINISKALKETNSDGSLKYNSQTSNALTFTYKRTAPGISSVEITPPSCYDSSDAEVKVIFNRDFRGTEQIDNLRLYEDGIPVYDIPASLLPITNLVTESDGSGWSFTFPESLNITKGNYELDMTASASGNTLYTDGPNHSAEVTIIPRPIVEFDGELEVVPVFCYGGNDGTITVTGQGGTRSFEYLFDNIDNAGDELPNENVWTSFVSPSNSEHIITGLTKGNYEVKIRDTNECVAKEQFTDPVSGEIFLRDNEIVKSIEVLEPIAPLSLTYIENNIIEPTAYGFANGQIQIVIQGGTQFDTSQPLYTVTWKDAAGITLTDVRSEVETDASGNNVYRVTLFNIPAGTYFVEVTDANHSAAAYKDTCYANSSRPLSQPDPLEISLRIDNEISCHIENEYSNGIDFIAPAGIMDQFQDGVIVAEVTGGVHFDASSEFDTTDCREGDLPYCYHWKKNIGGVWTDIDVNNHTIIDQSVGDYSLNVTDKNGISIGDYRLTQNAAGENEYTLAQARDSELNLPQPDKLAVRFEKTSVTCNDGKDAEAEVFVTGGTPPYTYSWSTGATITKVENLSAQPYIVFITDAKGCEIQGSVTIVQPNGLAVEALIEKSPTCFEGSDGVITVNITGGVTPYELEWSTGATTASINGLREGFYELEVTDFQGCKVFFETTLIDPEEIIVDLGGNRSLCNDQSLVLDIGIEDSGATYSWTSDNGFTSTQSSVELTQEGIYTATLTTGLGCIGVDTVEVKVFETLIDSDFLITTQAYAGQEVVLVNVSEPLGDKNEWTVPENVEVVDQSDEKLTMLFAEAGAYDIHLRAYQGDCYEDFTKTIIVQPALEGPVAIDGNQQFIEEFICYPNPSNGEFKTKISLTENSNITLKLLDMATGVVLSEQRGFGQQDFLMDSNMTSLAKGLYFMLLETPKGSETRKVIIE